jgi:melibiose permease/lactose/raffinose/galactose permease
MLYCFYYYSRAGGDMAAKALSLEDRQYRKNKWSFSIGSMGRDFGYSLVSGFLITYIQFGIQLTVAQFTVISLTIGVLGRVWDGVNDPLMGAIIEGTHFKWGKFKPWILIGALLYASFTLLMFNIRPEGWAFVIFIIVAYLLWETSFTMNDIGYYSLLPSLTSDKSRRNTLMMLTVFFSGVGGALLQGMVALFSPGNILIAYTMFSIIAAVLIISLQILTAFGVKENPRPEEEKQQKVSFKDMVNIIKRNDQLLWMSLAMLFYNLSSGMLGAFSYNIYYLEIGYDGNMLFLLLAFGASSMIPQVLFSTLAKKFTRRQLQAFTTVMVLSGQVLLFSLGWFPFLPLNVFTLGLSGMLIISGQAIFYMTIMINITNCVEYNEYKFGKRSEAVVSTMRPLIVKFADAVKYGIVTVVLIGSGVFLLSQNISNVETQKNYFEKAKEVTATIDGAETSLSKLEVQKYYLEHVSEDIALLSSADDSNAAAETLQEEYNTDPVLSQFRLNAKYLPALENLRLFSGDTYICTLGEYDDEARLDYDSYSLEITGSYIDGEGAEVEFNVGNEVFSEQATVGMRVWLRVAVSGLSAIFMITCFILLRKKYIITEDYYDNMIKEIKERGETQQES